MRPFFSSNEAKAASLGGALVGIVYLGLPATLSVGMAETFISRSL